jgi:hypothetical protein
MADVLGKYSFLDIPDVNGINVLLVGDATQSLNGTANQISITGTNPTLTVGLANNPILPGTGSLTLPTGTTAQRPTGVNGMIRYNTTDANFEGYENGAWQPLTSFYTRRWFGKQSPISGTSTITWNNASPSITDGTQLWSQTLTPIRITSKFEISFFANVDANTANRYVIFSLFRNNTCIAVTTVTISNANRQYFQGFHEIDEPQTASPITYSVRAGIGGGTGTWRVNQSGSGNNFNGLLETSWIIREVE